MRCEFGPVNKFVPFHPVVLPDDPQMLYEMEEGSLVGKIFFIKRGGGKFVDKVRRAQGKPLFEKGEMFSNHKLNAKIVILVILIHFGDFQLTSLDYLKLQMQGDFNA